jgi:thiamine pyrophosphate-dependent acetolactate synthase large subunit-like protein
MPKVYEAIADTLATLGAEAVFGLMGSGNMALTTHLADHHRARFVGARHEAAAVGMAMGYAHAGGRVGVATVHEGPGVTNTLTALHEAARSRVPLLLLAGDTATTARWAIQDIDQTAVAHAVSAVTERVRAPHTAAEDVARAYRRAELERRPVVVSLPIDVQELPAGDGERLPAVPHRSRSRPPQADLAKVAELVAGARRPVVMGGRGAFLSGARGALEALAHRTGALLATSLLGDGLFAGNPRSIGVAGGFATPGAAALLGQADLVLAFGVSLNSWTTKHGSLFAADATIVQCDTDSAAIGRMHRADVGLLGDAGETAAALVDALVDAGELRGFAGLEAVPQPKRWTYDDAGTEDRADPRSLVDRLDELLPAERTLAVDSGGFMGWGPMHIAVPDPAGLVYAQGFGAVGVGLGTALGAAVARPDRLTVLVIGDGGLLMSLGELAAAVHHRLPVLIVVMNDAGYGAEIHHFSQLGIPTALAEFGETDFAAVARALGASGITATSAADLDGLQDWLEQPAGPMLVDCKITREVQAPWLLEVWQPGR